MAVNIKALFSYGFLKLMSDKRFNRQDAKNAKKIMFEVPDVVKSRPDCANRGDFGKKTITYELTSSNVYLLGFFRQMPAPKP